MVFSSTVFLFVFLPLCLGLYYVAPRGLRNTVLLAFSLLFYAWGEGLYAGLMLVSIAGNHLAGKLLLGSEDARRRKLFLVLGLIFNLGLLGVFKYVGWFVRMAYDLGLALGLAPPPHWSTYEIHLPIGISFFTFQAISYLIDVWRGHAAPQRRVADFALYIALFPQLVAGPIVRYSDVARQLRKRRHHVALFASGVQRFIQGLAKKVLVANVLAVPATQVLSTPGDEVSTAAAWFGMLAYALQLYFDFSGYSDMAIGLGRMFGFRFRENFLHPYESRSITEFWRRWHVSLSSWFRDYLYFPMGGSRGSGVRTYINLWIVFLLVGLWHGAAPSFLVFGAYHGSLMVLERAFLGQKLKAVWGHIYATIALTLGWPIFGTNSLGEAWALLGAMVPMGRTAGGTLELAPLLSPAIVATFALGAVFATRLPIFAAARIAGALERIGAMPVWRTAAALGLLLLFVVATAELASGSYNPFIYFRF